MIKEVVNFIKKRKLHRIDTRVSAGPLALSISSLLLYEILKTLGIQQNALLLLAEGNFGIFDLSAWYPIALSLLTLLNIATGIALYPRRKNNKDLALNTTNCKANVAIEVETAERQYNNIFGKKSAFVNVDLSKG